MRLKSTVNRYEGDRDTDHGSSGASPLLLAGDDLRVDPQVAAAFRINDEVAAVRAIRARLIAAAGDDGARTSARTTLTAVVGLTTGDQAAVLAANLATVFAQLGTQTALVDAGLTDPAIASLFRTADAPGLADGLRTEGQPIAAQPTAIGGLVVVPAGSDPAGGESLLERSALVDQIANWNIPGIRQIIVALPHMAGRADALGNIVARFDSVVIVTEQGRTRIEDIRRIIDVLDQRGVPIVGTVIT